MLPGEKNLYISVQPIITLYEKSGSMFFTLFSSPSPSRKQSQDLIMKERFQWARK